MLFRAGASSGGGDDRQGTGGGNSKLRVLMVAWDFEDSRVFTSVSDFTIRVWDPSTGQQVRLYTYRISSNRSRPRREAALVLKFLSLKP